MGTVCVGAFMGQLDASIVSLALPTLRHDFHSTVADVQWVALSYLLVLVASVSAVGRLADMVGRKLLYLYGFGVFIVGSLLCGLAPSLLALDVFRVIQGLGAAMLQANSVAIIVLAVPRGSLGRAVGIQGAAQAIGLALGPAVGGFLIALGGWRLIFFVNVPAGIVGIVAGWYLIPRSRDLQERSAFDWRGLVLFFLAVGALMIGLSYGSQIGWTSPAVLATFGVSAATAYGFLRVSRRSRSPMIDLRLFRQPRFSTGIASGLLSYLVLFGILFVTPFFLESARALSPGATGAILAALPAVFAVVAPLAGRWGDVATARRLTVSGMLVAGAALVLLALFNESTILVAIWLGVTGLGLGLFTPVNNAAIMRAAPRQQSGSASGILNMTRGLGTSLGLAATGLVFASVAGTGVRPGLVSRGFSAAAIFLAIAATVAALVAAAQTRGTTSGQRDRQVGVDRHGERAS